MKSSIKRGHIIPNGVSLEKHENDIAVLFTELGYDVELIPAARQRRQKTADAIINGLEWEFKTAREGGTRAIEHLLRKALGQSENIIIDIRQLRIPQSIAIRRVEYCRTQVHGVKRLKVIVSESRIIDIS